MTSAASQLDSGRKLSVRDLPPWLISTIVHLVALIVLGLLYCERTNIAGKLGIELNWQADGAAGDLDLGTTDGGQNGDTLAVEVSPTTNDLQEQAESASKHLELLLDSRSTLTLTEFPQRTASPRTIPRSETYSDWSISTAAARRSTSFNLRKKRDLKVR